ncbi:MAG: 3-hydroxyacyl-CoA dehydrogenase [Euryarchaeota archaeon]|nr:3-hydroxyacyl-CoA dehydrogenase [Euryarchaeota archaeon]
MSESNLELEDGIGRVAVIGSGVMGAGVAAHCANAGCEVILLDIVPEGEEDRNLIPRKAIQDMIKSDPEMLMHKSFAKRIIPGNLEDDLQKLEDCDWVVEAIVERLDIKRSLYQKISQYIGPKTIVSSNTSTLPRSSLIEGMSSEMASRFLITHFFNPPRYLPLLEVVSDAQVDENTSSRLVEFADKRLGKRVIHCNDTPGFIGNRLGVFFIQRALSAAIEHDLTVEQADAMLGIPIGVPKTAVFGLMDLVGIDLVPHVMASMLEHLPVDDPLHNFAGSGEEIIQQMIAEGYTGRKGKGGFYRLNKEDGKRVKEARNLKTGEYSPADRKAGFPSAKMGKQGLVRLIDYPDEGAAFVEDVLLDTLSYAAFIVPEVSDDIYSIDGAMRVGYNWKKGPFEMIDSMGVGNFAKRLESSGRAVPPLIKKAASIGSFYSMEDGEIMRLTSEGSKLVVQRPEETIAVSDLKRKGSPLRRNPSASIWDMGDDILLVEYHSKMNAVDPMIIEMLKEAVRMAEEKPWKGIVIGNDGKNFSAGANLGLVLFAVNLSAWKEVEEFIESGQEAYQALKFCSVPVVGASAGLCLGGGAEVLLHCDAIQAHSESYIGLVEVGVGIIPAWGGCKEMLARIRDFGLAPGGPMGPIMKAFEIIGTAQVAKSADQARSMGFLGPDDDISMNRDRLLADSKMRALEMSQGYSPPNPHTFNLPGHTARIALEMAVSDLERSGNATPHDVVVTSELAKVLSGGEADFTDSIGEEEILAMERESIGRLGRLEKTMQRMEHMLQTGKPLRN